MKELRIRDSDLLIFVDDEDYFRCKKEIWSLFGRSRKQICNTKGVQIANFILQNSEMYDHKDRNFLNNQKTNFRKCNHQQNMANTEKFSNKEYSSKYKGVSFCKRDKCWRAYIKVKGKTYALGTFTNQDAAARIYNEFALRYFGEFAVLNKVPAIGKIL